MDSRRAESFSDGVFAVAVTLLVINLLPIAIKMPLNTQALLNHTTWPVYVSYVVSFLTIGIMWMNHHALFAMIRRVDRPVLVLNLLLLMGVVAIPFPTALIADHLTETSGAPVAAVTYGLVMLWVSASYLAIWTHIARQPHRLGRRGLARPRDVWQDVRFNGGSVGYVAAILFGAFGLPYVSVALYGLIAVYYMFEHVPGPTHSSEADE
jgi:uncharacterized membrane protein